MTKGSINERDIRIEIFTSGIQTPIYMRITHLLTGKSVEGTGSSKLKLKKELFERLEEILGEV
jgi:hypothetical protein